MGWGLTLAKSVLGWKMKGSDARMDLGGFIAVSDILKCGVYALVYRGEVVYVGKSKSMLGRIYAHRSLRGKRTMPWLPIKGLLFDEIHIRPCHPDVIDDVEYEMINLYKPRHNIALKHSGKSRAPITLNIRGVEVTINRPRPQPSEGLRRL